MPITSDQKDEIGHLLNRLSRVLTLEQAQEAFMSGENLANFEVKCVGFANGRLVTGTTTFELNEERMAALAGWLLMARLPAKTHDEKRVADIGLKPLVVSILNQHQIFTVLDLRRKTVRELQAIPKLTKANVEYIVVQLAELDISLTY